jgi:hypothetical protein
MSGRGGRLAAYMSMPESAATTRQTARIPFPLIRNRFSGGVGTRSLELVCKSAFMSEM